MTQNFPNQSNHAASWLAVTCSFMWIWYAGAQPVIVSTVPADGATGVATSTPVKFTFSEPMDPTATSVQFLDPFDPFNPIPTAPGWTAGNTVLTCTPLPSFPANKTIYWSVDGQNPNGDPLDGNTFGSFTTSSGGGGGGSGTNAITIFSVGKIHHYNQTSAGAATLDPGTPYGFSGMTALASNRTANQILLTLPTSAVSNLVQLPPPQSEIYLLAVNSVNLSNYDATFPAGNYSFEVQAAASNQTVVINLPTTNSLSQPGAPHVTNYVAAQTVNPAQPFVLGWDAFPGGTAADYIDVDVGTNGSPNPGLPGALNGTARTFTIPANTLQAGTSYSSRVGFFHFVGSTNSSFSASAYRATYTEFFLVTTGASPLVLTNGTFSSPNFSFNVLCATDQVVTVEFRTNFVTGSWQTLLTTNNPPSGFHVIAPQAATNRFLFFRARYGS